MSVFMMHRYREVLRGGSGAARVEDAGLPQISSGQRAALTGLNLPLAAVEAIAGQSRLEFTFFGRANHAGGAPCVFDVTPSRALPNGSEP